MRIATIAENEAKLKLVMFFEEKVFAAQIATNCLMLVLVLLKLVTRFGLIVVLAVSEFLVQIITLQKISKIEKINLLVGRIEALIPFTARKVALKREGKKLVRVVDMRTAV